MLAKFSKYSSSFKGLISPTESVKAVLSVVENASIEKGRWWPVPLTLRKQAVSLSW
jgi:ATP sulfurylase